jgi:hypothetical protein
VFSECWKCHFRHPNSKNFSGEHAPGASYIGSSWLRHEIFKSISRTKSAKGWQLCIRSSYVLKFDAQIAANGVSGVYISKNFRGGGMPPDPPRMSHAFGASLHVHSQDAGFATAPPSKIFSGKCWRRGEKTKRAKNISQTYLAIYRAWRLKHIVRPTAVILFIVLKSKTRDVHNLVPSVSPSVIWER